MQTGKKAIAGVLALSLALGLGGCQAKTGKSENKSDSGEKTAESKAGETAKPDSVWNEEWEVTLSNSQKVQIDMKCLFQIPESPPNATVEAKDFALNSANKAMMTKALFGEDVYLFDIEHMPKEDLKEQITITEKDLATLNDKIKKAKQGGNDFLIIDELSFLQKRAEKALRKMRKCLKTASGKLAKAGKDDFKCSNYLGYIDGIAYLLDVKKEPLAYDLHHPKQSQIHLTLKDSRRATPKSLSGIRGEISYSPSLSYGSKSINTGNQCLATEEEAQNTAESFLEKIGLTHMVKTEEGPLVWIARDGDSQETAVYGYHFIFKPGLDGNLFLRPVESDLDESLAEISVTDEGVIDMTIRSPIEVESITPNVKTISADGIRDLLRTQMADYLNECLESKKAEGWSSVRDSYYISGIKLFYCRVENPGRKGSYSYVPAWDIGGWLIINAIDGGLIFFL